MKIYFFSLLLVSSVVLAGCDYGKQVNTQDTSRNTEKGDGKTSEADSIQNKSTDVETSVTIQEALKEADVTVRSNDAQTQWTVLLDGKEVGKIPASSPGPDAFIEVEKYAQRKDRVYLGVWPSGIGGYILYSGPRELYVLDVEKSTLKLFLDLSGKDSLYGIVTDISKDDTRLAYITWEGEGAVVNVWDMTSNTTQQYAASEEFHVAGDAKFSPDGSQLAYAAAIGDSSAEEGVVMVIRLDSGEQKELNRIQGNAFRIEEWVEGYAGLIYRQL